MALSDIETGAPKQAVRAAKAMPGPTLRNRLLVTACLPVVVATLGAALLVVAATARGEREELRARAKLVAAALAESAEYDLQQGNRSSARRAMQAVLSADASVRQITLLDEARAPLLTVGEAPRDEPYEAVEASVQVTGAREGATPGQPQRGFVKVLVADPGLSAAKRAGAIRAYLALTLIAACCLGLGVALAQRLSVRLAAVRDSLQALSKLDLEEAREIASGGAPSEFPALIDGVAQRLAEAGKQAQGQLSSQTRDLHALLSAASREAKDKQRLLDDGDKLIERERARIAGEIHDQLGAGLVSIRLQAEALTRKAREAGQETLASIASSIVEIATTLYDTSRSITRELRPEALEMLGLDGAIAEMVRRLDESHPKCHFRYHRTPSLRDPDEQISITAYRVVQEALTNIVKHADAEHVDVTLNAAEPPRHMRIVVADDGKGLRASAGEGTGLGMIGMRERVERVSGVMSVTSGSEGTVLTFVL
jgi:signal transduction histidine kinase